MRVEPGGATVAGLWSDRNEQRTAGYTLDIESWEILDYGFKVMVRTAWFFRPSSR